MNSKIRKRKKASTTVISLLKVVLNPLPVPKKLKFYTKAVSEKLVDYLEFNTLMLLGLAPEQVAFHNCEGITEFNFTLPRTGRRPGISAFIRAKNEENKIWACLLSIIDAFDEIVFIDNQSEDATLNIVHDFKTQHDPTDKIKVTSYPFSVARCGSDHLRTPEDSVSNLAYFYNYTVSHCTCRYVVKWDADMILCPDRLVAFQSFSETINNSKRNYIWCLNGQTLYRDQEHNFWLSHEEVYAEPRVFPLSYFNTYAKGWYFETFKSPFRNRKLNLFRWLSCGQPLLTRRSFDGIAFYELKFYDQDEFSHWTEAEMSEIARKRKEMEAFRLIKCGKIRECEAFMFIEQMPFQEWLTLS